MVEDEEKEEDRNRLRRRTVRGVPRHLRILPRKVVERRRCIKSDAPKIQRRRRRRRRRRMRSHRHRRRCPHRHRLRRPHRHQLRRPHRHRLRRQLRYHRRQNMCTLRVRHHVKNAMQYTVPTFSILLSLCWTTNSGGKKARASLKKSCTDRIA